MKKIIQNIFSIKNSDDKTNKILTIGGIKFKFKNKHSRRTTTHQPNNYRFIELNKSYFKVKNHCFWNEYDKQNERNNYIYIYNTFKMFLLKDTTYIDINTHVGLTIFYAAELGCKNIYGIVANPMSYELVKENCSMNKLTEDVHLDNLYIADKDNNFTIPSKKIVTYLQENKLIEKEDVFIKIDLDGVEETIWEDLENLSHKDNITICLLLYPSFIKNKQENCEKLSKICCNFQYILDSSLQLLTKEKLKEILSAVEQPSSDNTITDNFIEITLSHKSVNYKKYWIEDKCKNIIPLVSTEFPEGWNPIDVVKDIVKEYPHESVLDFGCGYGRLSKSFDRDKYLGIDLNPNALQVARENNPDYNYLEFYVDSASYPEADLCIAYTVFLHLDDITLNNTLGKLTKSIKKTFIISEILGHEWRRGGLPAVFNREKEEYIEIMENFGFEFDKEIRKPYKRYAESKTFNGKNTDISFLIFRKTER